MIMPLHVLYQQYLYLILLIIILYVLSEILMIVGRRMLIFVRFIDVISINLLNVTLMLSFHDVILISMYALQPCLMLIMRTILYMILFDLHLQVIRLKV